MKLGTYATFTKKEDIQIQTAISRLLVHIDIPNGVAFEDVKCRIRAFGTKGFQPVIERTSMLDLMEIAASRVGHFTKEDLYDGSNNAVAVRIKGQIDIGVEASLLMPAQCYLSLDVEAPFAITQMALWAVAGPITTNKFHKYTPVSVQGTLKDIPLAGIDSIVFAPSTIKSLKFQYPEQASDFDIEELECIARNINDLVYKHLTEGVVVTGFDHIIEMATKAATRVTVEPAGTDQFNILCVSTDTLF